MKNRLFFFDITDSKEISDQKSKCNLFEADFTKQLIEFMAFNCTVTGTLKQLSGSIGVITPYKSQVMHLKNKLHVLCRTQNLELRDTIEVNTVDAFQGREKDIIIFNCVRSNFSTNIQSSLGFLTDERRLNVAITRPRHFLIIIGNAQTLELNEVWANLIEHCKSKNCYIPLTKSILLP